MSTIALRKNLSGVFNENHQLQMQDSLWKRLQVEKAKGLDRVRIFRSEVVRVGRNMGLTEEDSLALVESIDWVGETTHSPERGFLSAWITDVR